MNVPDRIMARIEPQPSGCHLWTGAVTTSGYGNVYFKGKYLNVHRLIAGAEKGDVVRHTCDVPLCCNPDHLRIGTQKDNMQDMAAKNRGIKGVLTDEQVIEARKLYADGHTVKEVIRALGLDMSEPGARSMINGSRYGHVPGERHRKNEGY